MNNNKLKEIGIKNHTYFYFDDIINIKNLDILSDGKSYENTLIDDVAYKTPHGAKNLHIIFNKTDKYVRKYDGTKYLALFHSDEKYERAFDRMRYLIMLNSNILDACPHKYSKII